MSTSRLYLFAVSAAMISSLPPADGSEPAKRPTSPASSVVAESVPPDAEVVTFAGGCFWCVEEVFHQTPGIYSAVSGYMGDSRETATYEEVCTGRTNHAEAVQVHFDPKVLPFDKLLDVFWNLHDPTQVNRQGPDRGRQYRSGIYYHSEEQRKTALASKEKLERSGKYEGRPIATEILPAREFFKAEDYHQNYARLNPQNPYLHYQLWPKLRKFGMAVPGQATKDSPQPPAKETGDGK